VNVAQPARFLAVGVAGYGVNVLAFAALYAAGSPYAAASIVAYLFSNALMYLGNRYFTFRLGHRGFWSAYARYLLVGLLVAGLTAIVLVFFVEVLGLHPTLGQALALLVVLPVAFVLIKRWTFQLREPGSATVGRASR
jgi:putative flippase GtrA